MTKNTRGSGEPIRADIQGQAHAKGTRGSFMSTRPETVANALRPTIRQVAREVAPRIKAAARAADHPASFEGMASLAMQGVFQQELTEALHDDHTED